MKNKIVGLLVLSLFYPLITSAAGNHLSGKIFLQVESHGEAWYVNPDNNERYYLGRPDDAFSIMRSLGLGISNADLHKIPVAIETSTGVDSDSDGLSDLLEDALKTNKQSADSDNDGYSDSTEVGSWFNPSGAGRLVTDTSLVQRLKGKILLQVESSGEAWYLNPANGRRYFLGRPADAFSVMRSVGVGISNADLATIRIHGNGSGSVQTAACGEALLTESSKEHGDTTKMQAERQQLKSVYDCITQKYRECQPATATINQVFSINRYEIVGIKNGACEVKVMFDNAIDPGLNGQTMVCQMDRSRSMFVETGNYLACEGGAAEYVTEEDLVGWSIVGSSDVFSYTEQEIVWTTSVSTENPFSRSKGVTVTTVNDQGVDQNIHVGGEF